MARIFAFLERYWLTAAVAAAATFVGGWLARTERLREVEFEIQQRLQLAITPAHPSRKIVLVVVSPDDNRALTGMALVSIPRSFHATLINGLKRAGARVVVFDLLFASPDGSESRRSAAARQVQDRAFTQAVMHASPLGVVLCQQPGNSADPTARNGYRYHFEPPYFLPRDLPANVALGEAEPVYTGALYGELALLCRNRATGKEVPGLALLAYCLYRGVSPTEIVPHWRNHEVEADTIFFPMDGQGGMPVDWTAVGRDFETMPYSKALSALRGPEAKAAFANKVVFVTNEDDRVVNTVSGPKFGSEVLAAQLNTMLRRDQGSPKPASALGNELWGILVAGSAALAQVQRRRRVAVLGSIAVVLGSVLLPLVLFALQHWAINVTGAFLVALLAVAFAAALRAAMPTAMLGRPRYSFEATVLVIDLRSSTDIVRSLGAAAGGSRIARAVQEAGSLIELLGGVVLRSQGDGLIALFRAGSNAHHVDRAIEAARRIAAIPALEAQPSDWPAFRCGLESGVLHGDEFEPQGLAIHVAARLEALGREAGVSVLIGPTAYGLATDAARLHTLGVFPLKGLGEATRVYSTEAQPSG